MSLDAIGIVSGDLAKSVRFYEILGVDLKENGSADHLEGSTPSGVRIMLDTVELIKKINPSWKQPSGNGIILCFKQGSPAEVNEVFEKVLKAGFRSLIIPWDAFWGQRYASVLDPDGNQVDLFAPL
jgi:catechol 2,3-dioxygenase-like lactoylglutathione lyase family enzyme